MKNCSKDLIPKKRVKSIPYSTIKGKKQKLKHATSSSPLSLVKPTVISDSPPTSPSASPTQLPTGASKRRRKLLLVESSEEEESENEYEQDVEQPEMSKEELEEAELKAFDISLSKLLKLKESYMFKKSDSPIMHIMFSDTIESFVIVRENKEVQFLDTFEMFFELSKNDLYNIAEIGIQDEEKYYGIRNFVTMLRSMRKVDFKNFKLSKMDKINEFINFPTIEDRARCETPTFITIKVLHRKYILGEQLTMSIRPIETVFYDRGYVYLKRFKRKTLMLYEPEMFIVLIRDDVKHIVLQQWVYLKDEYNPAVLGHAFAFEAKVREMIDNCDGIWENEPKSAQAYLNKMMRARSRR